MSRRELREHIFKMLFRKEFHNQEELNEQIQFYFDELEEPATKDVEYLTKKFNNIMEHIEEIDAIIEQASEGWKLNRMGRVDLTLMRVATYEIFFDEEVPTGVAINEAVEISKKYAEDNSPSFINGVLAKVAESFDKNGASVSNEAN
ncbi:transcription termination protein NusB [Lachnospiraceae bacterium KM106-2]|nr:transcription termination protein NusB [Lachnospiraceae bacterium KM106-2]